MGTARILATSMEYANATKVDNRRASQIRHRLLPASPAHQKVVSRKGLIISRVIVKAKSPKKGLDHFKSYCQSKKPDSRLEERQVWTDE